MGDHRDPLARVPSEQVATRAIDAVAALREGLPSRRRHVGGRQPCGEFHRPALAHLRERVAVPLAEGAFGDPRLDIDGGTRRPGHALGRLEGAQQWRRDDGIDSPTGCDLPSERLRLLLPERSERHVRSPQPREALFQAVRRRAMTAQERRGRGAEVGGPADHLVGSGCGPDFLRSILECVAHDVLGVGQARADTAVDAHGLPARLRVQRLVDEAIGGGVLRTRHPGVVDIGAQATHGEREVAQRGVLDGPAPAHLLDDELGIQARLDPRLGIDLEGVLDAREDAAVLRDVVGRLADRLGDLDEDAAGLAVTHDRAVGRGAWIATRSPIGLDDEESGHRPDSSVRTRIRRHSSQRITSAGGASRIRLRSTGVSSIRQPSQRPRCSAAAPMPPLSARSLS